MALIKTVVLKNNFQEQSTFQNAYVKIESINGTKNKIFAKVVYCKQKDGVKIKRENFSFTPSLDGRNFIAQAYDHLKTLPEFAGATDC